MRSGSSLLSPSVLQRRCEIPEQFEKVRDTRNTVAMSDTSEKAREVYFRRLKGMTASERLELAATLWTAGDALQRAALRHENRFADDAEITFRIAVSRFGLELARKAYRKL
jgi:hypothetical protein